MGPVEDHDLEHSRTHVLAGGGEMGARMRAIDWSQTPLGPVDLWPQSLKTAVRIMLTSRQAMFVWWGPELINLYNDAYKSIVGGKHPTVLGQPASIVWREIWGQVAPRVQTAISENRGTYDEALLLIMERNGYPEETYYTFSYSPIPNDEGEPGGIICANTDDTQRIVGERQLALLRDLATSTVDARTISDACRLSAAGLASNRTDLPFAALYLLDQDKPQAVIAGTSGIEGDHPAFPSVVSLDASTLWPFAEVNTSQHPQVVELTREYGDLPSGTWERPPHEGVVVPIAASGRTGQVGMLVVGLNPFRLFDDNYRTFLHLVASHIGASIASAQAYEEERQRAEALAELDRAKTAFFNNISHEFRTPLTLMLGPMEDLLEHPASSLTAEDRAQLDVIYRNGQRLLKLVNTLLDFSRIEAGRIQATYQPTDLAALTTELASVFRSAIERSGMALIVNCPPLTEPAYVDQEMWEKIIFNLLSNAYKFTFAGEIEVAMQQQGATVRLSVRDTGTGIPEEEIPRLFERFHRVSGAAGRTFEGTGIGLALVQELVALHGGKVHVTSEVGKGSTFSIEIPLGFAHLPADRIGSARTLVSTAVRGDAYVEGVLRLTPSAGEQSESFHSPDEDWTMLPIRQTETVANTTGGHILLADDNSDMREYVRRLLSPHYSVEAVGDGAAALAAARARIPDLVLTDVMMPRLDGFGLLRELRADERTADVPVIMLSARAGEEARVEGLAAGTDDYLVKPFGARELLARVGARIELARLRRESVSAIRERETRLRASEEKLQMLYAQEQAARQQAETANHLKDEFLATVSHELRTPLTAILGYGQMIQARRRDEAYVARTLEKILRSAEAQAQLVEDLLDVSRIVSGKLHLDVRLMDMATVIHGAIDSVRPAIEARSIRLVTDLDHTLGPIMGDPNRLQQVAWNLLSNAVKFTPPGGAVHLQWQRHEDVGRLMVSDTGRGISAEFLPYVFDRFRQAESTSNRTFGGLGLGLSIVRHVVEMHGGTVQVQSEGEGKGATFIVDLPFAHAEPLTSAADPDIAPAPTSDCPPELLGLRILVVDDQPDILELIHEVLASCGAVVMICHSAREALDRLREWRPDILVSDIAMPGEDGFWLIHNVRSLSPEAGGNTPALALTAYIRMEDRRRVQEAGFQMYVPKPLETTELLNVVARLASVGNR